MLKWVPLFLFFIVGILPAVGLAQYTLNITLLLNTSKVNPREIIHVSGVVVNSSGAGVARVPLHLELDGSDVFTILDSKGYLEGENGVWKYWRKIIINGSIYDLYNYTLPIILDTHQLIVQGKLKSDCSDLRFIDSAGRVLEYWIESGCNTQNTTVWVKIPYIPADNETKIFMVYGNPDAIAGSVDPSNLFIFYDGFDFGLTGWTLSTYGLCSSSSYNLSNDYYSSPPYSLKVYSDPLWGFFPCIVMANKDFVVTQNGSYEIRVKYRNDIPFLGSNLIYSVVNIDGTNIIYDSYNGSVLKSGSEIVTLSAGTHEISVGVDARWTNGSAYFDDIIVRRVVNPEPTVIEIGDEMRFVTTNDSGEYSFDFVAPQEGGTHILKAEVFGKNGEYGWNTSEFVVRIGIINQSAIFVTNNRTSVNIKNAIEYPQLNISAYVFRNRDNPIERVWVTVHSPSGTTSEINLTNLTAPREDSGVWGTIANLNVSFPSIEIGKYTLSFHAISKLNNGENIYEQIPSPFANIEITGIPFEICTSKIQYNFINECYENFSSIFKENENIYFVMKIGSNTDPVSGLKPTDFILKDSVKNLSAEFQENLIEISPGIYISNISASSIGVGRYILEVEVYNGNVLISSTSLSVYIQPSKKHKLPNITVSVEPRPSFIDTFVHGCGMFGEMNLSGKYALAGLVFCDGHTIYYENSSDHLEVVKSASPHRTLLIFTKDNPQRVVKKLSEIENGKFDFTAFGYKSNKDRILRIIIRRNFKIENFMILHPGRYALRITHMGLLGNVPLLSIEPSSS